MAFLIGAFPSQGSVWLLWISLWLLPATDLDAGVLVEQRSATPTTQLKMTSAAEKVDPITNRIAWPPIEEMLPDGSMVKKGQTVIRFNREELQRNVDKRRMEMELADLRHEKRLLQIEGKTREILDNIETKRSELKVNGAKLKRYAAMPTPSDVSLAQGDLEVAELNRLKAKGDLQRAEQRFGNKTISPSALEKAKEEAEKEELRYQRAYHMSRLRQLGASSLSTNILLLKRENLELELEQLEEEYTNQKVIADLETQNADRRRQRSKRNLEDKLEELSHIELKAPRDGLVQHNARFSRSIIQGKKPEKGAVVMEMPHLDSIVFKGRLPEAQGGDFAVSDEALIHIPALGQRAFAGNVTHLARAPKDIMEESSNWQDMGRKSGIKFFPITVKPLEDIPGLRLGMSAEIEIISGRRVEGPSIPLDHVDRHQGKNVVYHDGWAEVVEGRPLGPWFFLKDAIWLGRTIEKKGEHRAQTGEEDTSNFYTLTGELLAQSAIEVNIPMFNRWHRNLKTQWVVPEGTKVEVGEDIIKLASQNSKERFDKESDQLEGTRLSLQTLTKEKELMVRKERTETQRKVNDHKIAKVELKITELGAGSSDLLQAMEAHGLAEIQEKSARRHHEQVLAKKELYSPNQIQRAERQAKRASLKRERAKIQLDLLQAEPTPRERAKALIKVARASHEMRRVEGNHHYQISRKANNIQRTQRSLEREERRQKEDEEDFDRFVVPSPAKGSVTYLQVWGGQSMVPLRANLQVWPNQRVMRIVDNSSVTIETDVAEHYTQDIQVGTRVKVDVPSMNLKGLEGEVRAVDTIYRPPEKPDTEDKGLYGTQEPLGETTFKVKIDVLDEGLNFKPGSIARITFPFEVKR